MIDEIEWLAAHYEGRKPRRPPITPTTDDVLTPDDIVNGAAIIAGETPEWMRRKMREARAPRG